jgi:hypothetical protein
LGKASQCEYLSLLSRGGPYPTGREIHLKIDEKNNHRNANP